MRLIDADALREDLRRFFPSEVLEGIEPKTLFAQIMHDIDNAPTVELDESVIQEVLNKRCMTAVANEYLIALHGKRPQGEWKKDDMTGILDCSLCGGQAPIDITSGEFSESPYCPWCGADMRGGEES